MSYKERPIPLPMSENCYQIGVVCKNKEKYDFCYWCCPTCNYDDHRCHFCGDPLTHSGKQTDGENHPCYSEVTIEEIQGKQTRA